MTPRRAASGRQDLEAPRRTLAKGELDLHSLLEGAILGGWRGVLDSPAPLAHRRLISLRLPSSILGFIKRNFSGDLAGGGGLPSEGREV